VLDGTGLDIDQVQVEVAPLRIIDIGGKDDMAPVRMPVGTEISGTIIGELDRLPVRKVHGIEFQPTRAHEILGEQVTIIGQGLAGWSRSAPDDPVAVAGEKGTAIVAGSIGQLLEATAVRFHQP